MEKKRWKRTRGKEEAGGEKLEKDKRKSKRRSKQRNKEEVKRQDKHEPCFLKNRLVLVPLQIFSA